MTAAQMRTVDAMPGWVVTNIYGDGIVRIAEHPEEDARFCFVRPDGSCGPVKTWDTVWAEIALKDAAVEVRWVA